MKCTKCGLREATTEVVRCINNHVEKMYLCNECAKDFTPKPYEEFDSLNQLIKTMGFVPGVMQNAFIDNSRPLVCPNCKTTADEFMKNGYVGCTRCYKEFEPLIVQTVKKIQQSDRHVGKCPQNSNMNNSSNENERAWLEEQLKNAESNHDYALADKIFKRLKKFYDGGDN